MPTFLYFQSMVQYRIPIGDDGKPGTPEITGRFTSPFKGAQHNVAPKKKQQTLKGAAVTEEYQ